MRKKKEQDYKPYVWQRDFKRCLLCGSIDAAPIRLFDKRKPPIPSNLWTGCIECYQYFQDEEDDGPLHRFIQAYLEEHKEIS